MAEALINEIEKESAAFEELVRSYNPQFAYYMDVNGCPITNVANIGNATFFCTICENPLTYPDNVGCVTGMPPTEATFRTMAASIRQSVTGKKDLCGGQLNKSFFSGAEKNADVLFLLYQIHETDQRKKFRFSGFVCCNDLTALDEEDDEELKHEHVEDCDLPPEERENDEGKGGKTLYIDAICAKTNELGPEAEFAKEKAGDQGVPKIRLGSVLLNTVEDYAKLRGFDQLKLSALTYVINYYRRLGYKHDCGCDDSETDNIKRLGDKASKFIFGSETVALLTYNLEKSIILCSGDKSLEDTQLEISNNLKTYVDEDTFYDDDMGTSSDKTPQENLGLILAHMSSKTFCKPRGTPYPVTMDNIKDKCVETNDGGDGIFGLYKLLSELSATGKSVACSEWKTKSTRQQAQHQDEDGDTIDCGDEGYTMRKCIKDQNYNCRDEGGRATIDKTCVRPEAQGGAKKKRKTKKNKKAKKHKKTHKKRKRKSKSKKKKSKRKTKKSKK